MNIIFNALFIFAFIFVALVLDFKVINKDDALVNKIYLFAGIFLLEMIILSVDRIKTSCAVTTQDTFKEAAKIALLAVVAYSIYIDILVFPKYEMYKTYTQDPKYGILVTSGIISSLVAIMKFIDNLVFPKSC